jgi:hypothetical protein
MLSNIKLNKNGSVNQMQQITLDKRNVIIFILGVVCIALIGFGIYTFVGNSRSQRALDASQKELMKAQLDLGKAETEKGNAQKELKKADQEIQDWIKKYGGKAEQVGFFSGKYDAVVKLGLGEKIKLVYVPGSSSTVYLPGASGTVEVSNMGEAIWIDTDGDGQPDQKTNQITLKYKDYRIDITVDVLKNLFSYNLHQKFTGEWVEAILPNGAVTHFMKIYELDDKGQKVNPIELTDFKVTIEDKTNGKKHFYAWDPQIDFALSASTSNRLHMLTGTEIGFSMMGYGKTKDDNDWRFIRFAVGATKGGYSGNFSPVCYNIGKPLPIIKDLLMCPTVGMVGSETTFGISFGNPF